MEQIKKISNFAQDKYAWFAGLCAAIPFAVVLLIARFAGAIDFWKSGQTKIASEPFLGIKWNFFDIVEKKYYLFEHTYGIPKPLVPSMTQAATIGEFILPLLLVLGLTSRFAALGLLGMTAFIQFYVYPEELLKFSGNWSTHLLWTAPLLLILVKGPGTLSLDYLLGRDRKAT